MALLPSAPASRLIRLIDHLATTGEELTASELSRATGINRTTCLSLLLALEEHGWVNRRSGAKYALGAALIALGDAALSGLRVVEEVQPELDRLASSIGMEALASTVSNNEIVVIAHARGAGVLSNTVRVGQTIPFVPPFGFAHLVGADEDAVERWLDRAPRALAQAEREEYRSALSMAAIHGYIVVLDADSQRRFEALNRTLAERPSEREARRERHDLIADFSLEHLVVSPREGAMAAEVSQIQAPVRGLGQRNSLAIGVHGLPHQIDQSRITEHVAMITAAADRLTQRLGGRSRPS